MEIVHVGDQFALSLCCPVCASIDSAVKVKGPKQTRDGEEDGAVGDMHALAFAAAGAEDEVVAFGGVRVVGCYKGGLVVGYVACRVEGAGVGVSFGVVVDGPFFLVSLEGREGGRGISGEEEKKKKREKRKKKRGDDTHQTFIITVDPFGM